MRSVDLEGASFWHAGVCLSCESVEQDFDDERSAAQVCEECDRGVVVSARLLTRFIERLEDE